MHTGLCMEFDVVVDSISWGPNQCYCVSCSATSQFPFRQNWQVKWFSFSFCNVIYQKAPKHSDESQIPCAHVVASAIHPLALSAQDFLNLLWHGENSKGEFFLWLSLRGSRRWTIFYFFNRSVSKSVSCMNFWRQIGEAKGSWCIIWSLG